MNYRNSRMKTGAGGVCNMGAPGQANVSMGETLHLI